MTRALVLGATGRVGSAVVTALPDDSVDVRAGSRNPDAARDRLGVGPEYVDFDFARPETWGPALDGVDRLFLVYPPGVSVGTVGEFVDAAGRTGVERVAFLSILGAGKVPVLPHRRIERRVADAVPAATFLRAAYFMQNLSGIHRPEIVARDELFVPAGDGALGFVDARDVGAVAATVLADDGLNRSDGGCGTRAYDLTGPAALDFHEVASVFSAVLDRRITYADPSRLTFARRMYARGVPASMIAFMLAEYQVTRFGLSGRTTDDVEAALGRPPTALRTFVEDYREQFEAGAEP